MIIAIQYTCLQIYHNISESYHQRSVICKFINELAKMWKYLVMPIGVKTDTYANARQKMPQFTSESIEKLLAKITSS